MANLTVSTEGDAVGVNILPELEHEITERRRLHRVPPYLRENKRHVYDPIVLSLGPYHHNQVEFPQMEAFKEEVYNYMLESIGGDRVMDIFRQKIREKIQAIRNFYGGVGEDKFDDKALTEIMVRDSCFVVYCMELVQGDLNKLNNVIHHLGTSGYTFMLLDFCLLDNQIPLCVINLLISLKYANPSKEEELLRMFLSVLNFRSTRLKQLPWKGNESQPLHLLEARRAALVKEALDTDAGEFRSKGLGTYERGTAVFELLSSPFRSVTYLQSKGVHFQPSSYSLRDIRFKTYKTHGTLYLPQLLVSRETKVLFSNMMAFEMSPESEVDTTVQAYVDFMKSLIQKPEDVKELREKSILFSLLGNDEEVVNIFKEIDTYGTDNVSDFLDVKMGINEHCNSKANTWMAELIHSKFRNPWTAIAFFAAIFLLCLTLIQTYYAINPK